MSCSQRSAGRRELFLRDFLDVFVFWIIDVDFDVRDHIQQGLDERIEQLTHAAADALHGQLGIFPGLRLDHVVDRFGLGQVDAPVEEGALGKFPGPGKPCALCQHELQDHGGDASAAVAADLYDVFPGICARRAEHGDEHFVHLLSRMRIDDETIGHGV